MLAQSDFIFKSKYQNVYILNIKTKVMLFIETYQIIIPSIQLLIDWINLRYTTNRPLYGLVISLSNQFRVFTPKPNRPTQSTPSSSLPQYSPHFGFDHLISHPNELAHAKPHNIQSACLNQLIQPQARNHN